SCPPFCGRIPPPRNRPPLRSPAPMRPAAEGGRCVKTAARRAAGVRRRAPRVRRWAPSLLTLVVLLLATACGSGAGPGGTGSAGGGTGPADGPAGGDGPSGEKPTLVFGDFSWDSVQVHNRIAGFIIEHGYGYPVDYKFGDTVPILQGLQDG